MATKKNRKIYECQKFIKAVRFEIPFEDINFAKANDEITLDEYIDENPELSMEITAKDFLCGLKKVKTLKGNKKENAYKSYIKKIAKIYKKEDLNVYWAEDSDMSQYPAPRQGFYVDYIMNSILKNRFDIDESIMLLETYIKNKQKPFLKKKIPEVGILEMVNSNDLIYYKHEPENINNKLLQEKIVEYIDKVNIFKNIN